MARELAALIHQHIAAIPLEIAVPPEGG